jgi:hypothetical protein
VRGTARLDEAAGACHAALKEYTLELAPLSWTAANGNQGIVLARLAERQYDGPMAACSGAINQYISNSTFS